MRWFKQEELRERSLGSIFVSETVWVTKPSVTLGMSTSYNSEYSRLPVAPAGTEPESFLDPLLGLGLDLLLGLGLERERPGVARPGVARPGVARPGGLVVVFLAASALKLGRSRPLSRTYFAAASNAGLDPRKLTRMDPGRTS